MKSRVNRSIGRMGVLAAAAVAAAAGTAAATPLRLEYCVESLGGGLYQYSFTLILDNNDNTWAPGQGWGWFIFGDASGMSSPLTNWQIDPASLPVGPWTGMSSSGGGHNGPTFSPVTNANWEPTMVGDNLRWRGTSTAYIAEPGMLFSTLQRSGGAAPTDFVPAVLVSCGEIQGACCRPDGSCIIVNAQSCTNENGIYRGDNTTCGTANCPQPPTGACCTDAGCAIFTEAQCLARSGTYQGDNSSCGTANCPPATAYREEGDVGDVPSTAAVVNNGTGSLTTIHGTFNRFNDADMYKIRICDPGNFSANIAATGIREIFLFHEDGLGIACRYSFNGPATITNQFVASLPPGDYYLAVASFLKMARDSSNQYLWLTDHFGNLERQPNGPGAANPIDNWDNGGGADGPYMITLTGACFTGSTPPPCYANCDGSTVEPILNVSDFICFQTRFAAADTYANCDGSTVEPILNVSDFICFQSAFAAGCT